MCFGDVVDFRLDVESIVYRSFVGFCKRLVSELGAWTTCEEVVWLTDDLGAGRTSGTKAGGSSRGRGPSLERGARSAVMPANDVADVRGRSARS